MMNNLKSNRFGEVQPGMNIRRSMFGIPNTHKTTFNAGELIPLETWEVLPGDTLQVDTSLVVRMSTPIYPVMDNAYFDLYYFYVPSRLLWQHFQEFMGENNTTFWEQPIEYEVPQVTAPEGGWSKGTLADHFGIPTKVAGLPVNALYFRGYCKIFNDWFRDENLVTPANMPIDDADVVGSNGADPVLDAVKGGMPLKIAKYADYFTTALPSPQKGSPVRIPLGDFAPITLDTDSYEEDLDATLTGNTPVNSANMAFSWYHPSQDDWHSGSLSSSNQIPPLNAVGGLQFYNDNTSHTYSAGYGIIPNGAYLNADLRQASSLSINDLRFAFALQGFLELQARSGSRYTEILRSMFNVISPDARLQRSEYLGGKRIPINVSQVLQTSASVEGETPQGNTAAYSLTTDKSSSFTKSFTEHGIVFALGAVRTDHSYQQGLDKAFSRRKRYDYYFPVFANIGEQPIYYKEIFAQGTAEDDDVFGYQEAFAEYRFKPNRVTGAFRSNVQGSLDAWHYADYYQSKPFLGSSWIAETSANVDRTLAVQSELEDQFIGDFYFNTIATRPMPVFSTPSLIGHH